jgi:hypothetical protein
METPASYLLMELSPSGGTANSAATQESPSILWTPMWHSGLLCKIKQTLPPSYFNLFRSYLRDPQFQIKVGNEKSEPQPIKAGVPQGSVLGPTLYTLFASDLPTSPDTSIGTSADDIARLSANEDPERAASNLQRHLSAL